MRWYSPSGKGAFCDPVELPLLRRLLSLLTDKLDLSFLCTLCDTGVDGCFLGCSVVGAEHVPLEPEPDPLSAPVLMVAPQEHTRGAPALLIPGWIPPPLLSAGVPVPLGRQLFWSLAESPSGKSDAGRDSEWGWAARKYKGKEISFLMLLIVKEKLICLLTQTPNQKPLFKKKKKIHQIRKLTLRGDRFLPLRVYRNFILTEKELYLHSLHLHSYLLFTYKVTAACEVPFFQKPSTGGGPILRKITLSKSCHRFLTSQYRSCGKHFNPEWQREVVRYEETLYVTGSQKPPL